MTDVRRYYDDDKGDHAVVSFGEPVRSGHLITRRDHLANVTSLERERWKRAHPRSAGRWGPGSSQR